MKGIGEYRSGGFMDIEAPVIYQRSVFIYIHQSEIPISYIIRCDTRYNDMNIRMYNNLFDITSCGEETLPAWWQVIASQALK